MLAALSAGRQRPCFPLAAALIVALILCWSYVSCFSAVAYTYLYWLRPELHYASAGAAAPAAERSGQRSGGGGSKGAAAGPTVVPRVIHQTWKTKEVPQEWRAAQQSCIDLHKDWEYRLWTDADGLAFIEEEYPWFLSTYLSYPYNIQRVDVLRYFILHKLGGVYIDLDMGCLSRLDFMLDHNFTAPLTHPVGISNDVMAAAPGNSYLSFAIPHLRHWNRWLFIKYVQVMFSTGPMFLTVQYSLFPHKSDVAVIPAPLYGKYDSSGAPAFYHLHGSSWHAGDAHLFLWADQHGKAMLVGAALAGAVLLAFAWRRCSPRGAHLMRGGLKPAE